MVNTKFVALESLDLVYPHRPFDVCFRICTELGGSIESAIEHGLGIVISKDEKVDAAATQIAVAFPGCWDKLRPIWPTAPATSTEPTASQ